MKVIASTTAPLSCPLPFTDMRRPYVPAHMQTVDRLAETFRQYAPIHVSPAYGDDYDLVERTAHLDMAGEFR